MIKTWKETDLIEKAMVVLITTCVFVVVVMTIKVLL